MWRLLITRLGMLGATLVLTLVLSAVVGSPIASAQTNSSTPAILIVGDSLSAGFGVGVDSTWVALLQRRLSEQGYGYRVINASASGETTGGARTRLARVLTVQKPSVVVIELGGNDALRGLPLQQIRANLAAMIEAAQATGARVVLVGMRIPPNYGASYAEGFYALFGALAKQYDVAHVDFFLEGIALDDSLMQDDGIHPSAAAQGRLLENIWPALRSTLKK